MFGSFLNLNPFYRNQPSAKGYRRISRLNRSRRWPTAKSYEHAREIARIKGASTQPVR